MQRLAVESSDLVSVGYDPKERLLEVEFHGGRVYHYFDVQPDIYEGMMRAKSIGQYFSTYIINYYRYRRISDAEQADPVANGCRISFVTGNARKVRDLTVAGSMFGIKVDQLEIHVDEIQHHDPLEITKRKADDAYKAAKRPIVVNDVTWEIPVLKGFPGGYMKDVQEWFTAEDFLRLMQGIDDRRVCMHEVIVYKDAYRTKIFTKDFWGTITEVPRGRGPSITQVVSTQPEGKDGKTIAEFHQDGNSSIPHEDYVWYDFAKWYAGEQDSDK